VRVYGRGSNYKLGPNQRDDAVDVSRLVVQGRNTVGLAARGLRGRAAPRGGVPLWGFALPKQPCCARA
jgi:hypothetical protein